MKQKILMLFTSLLFYNFIFAQNKMVLPDNAGIWILDKTVANVDFYHMIKECSGNTVVLLKFNNNSNFQVKVSWKDVFVTEQVSEKQEAFYGNKILVLSPGQVMSSDCGKLENSVCMILPKNAILHYKADIRNFEFKDIIVTTMK